MKTIAFVSWTFWSLFVSIISALYSFEDDVIVLSDTNFQDKVIDSNDVWYVKFYSSSCGHCVAFAPEFKKAATAVKGFAKFGALDITKHNSLAQQYEIKGVPDVKIFAGENRFHPKSYDGARDARALTESVINTIRSVIRSRLGFSSSSSDVIELTDDDFDSTLKKENNSLWLVKFYAPWCGHCKNLAPEWARAASLLKGKVKLGAVDATKWTKLATRFSIDGFPTIKVFYPDGTIEDYKSARNSDSIVSFAIEKARDILPPPEIVELISSEVFDEACKKQICLIAFLPDILDCQSKCRNEMLSMIRNLSSNYKEREWGWLWIEGGRQADLEEAVGVGGFGYPALVALNLKKKLNEVFRGAFDVNGLGEFFRDLSYGRGFPVKLQNDHPTVLTLSPWDGKDGEYPVDEGEDEFVDEIPDEVIGNETKTVEDYDKDYSKTEL